jgi:hypothetical protein
MKKIHQEDSSVNDLFLERFKRRLHQVKSTIRKEELRRPPNPDLNPTETVTAILDCLRQPHKPTHLFGFQILLQSSTPSFHDLLHRSVGAPLAGVPAKDVCAALEAAFSRPKQQFRILVGQEEDYYPTFPTDYLDYEDGTCWLECRLRDKRNDKLLVALGWSLERSKVDGSWLIDAIDWQDFRDSYRPGIGREEWDRICG